MATNNKPTNQVKQEMTSSPEKKTKNDEHGAFSHRPEHLTVTTDELQLKLAHVLGPKDRFFSLPEISVRQAVGITPQPPTPVSTKDSSRLKSDDHNKNGKGLNSTPPSTKLLHTSNAGDESASSFSSNKTSSIVPSAAPMKKIKSTTSATATTTTTTTSNEKTIVPEKNNTGDDTSSLLQRGVKSATSSPNFPVAAAAEPRSGSQRQPTTDKKPMAIAKSELNLKLFGFPNLSSSESESESDSDNDSNDSQQHRFQNTAPAATTTSNNNNNSNKKQPSFVAPVRKTGRHALTASTKSTATTNEESAAKVHHAPPPLLNLQQNKDLHSNSANTTPQKAATTAGSRIPGIDDISSIYKNITLPSPLSPQLLSPVISQDMLLPNRASLSKQQFSPVLPTLSSSTTASEVVVAAINSNNSPPPPTVVPVENCVKNSPKSPSSPLPTLPAVSPPLPSLQPPPSWSLSTFAGGVDAKKQPTQQSTKSSTTTTTTTKVASKPSAAEQSRKTKFSSGNEEISSGGKKQSPNEEVRQKPAELSPEHQSKAPKVRRVIGESSPPQNNSKKPTTTQQKIAVTTTTTTTTTTPKTGDNSGNNKRPVSSSSSCHVSTDTCDLPAVVAAGKVASIRGIQTSPNFAAKSGRECGFFIDGFSQTSWDLRAAFSTNCGVQTGSSAFADATIQTETNSGGDVQDAFGPTAPKQARRETACVQPLNVTVDQQASTSQTGDTSSQIGVSSGVDSQSQLLRSKFTIKPKTTLGGSSPFEPPVVAADLLQRERERRTVNVIDWRGTYTEQTLQSEKTYYEKGRLSKREADQEFPKQRNLDAFCIYLDAMLAFLLQVCAHESAHGGKAESKRRQQLLTFIDEALSKCAPTARDLTIDPRWDIPLVLCHQSKAVLATRLYDMQSRDMLNSAASSIERAVVAATSSSNNQQQHPPNSSQHTNNSSSPPGSVGSNSSGTSSGSATKQHQQSEKVAGGIPSHLAKSIEMVTNAFRLLEASKSSWARAEELSDKHKAFFDRFSPTLTLRASLLDLSSYLDRCITEFRALRNATGPAATLAPLSSTPSSKATAAVGSSAKQLLRPPPTTAATTKH